MARAGFAQWWEHSSFGTDVARVRFRPWRRTWVKFDGSLHCFEGFSQGTAVFSSYQKTKNLICFVMGQWFVDFSISQVARLNPLSINCIFFNCIAFFYFSLHKSTIILLRFLNCTYTVDKETKLAKVLKLDEVVFWNSCEWIKIPSANCIQLITILLIKGGKSRFISATYHQYPHYQDGWCIIIS